MKYLLVPLHITLPPSDHWALILADVPAKQIRYYASAQLPGRVYLQVRRTMGLFKFCKTISPHLELPSIEFGPLNLLLHHVTLSVILQNVLAYLKDEAQAKQVPFFEGEWKMATIKVTVIRSAGHEISAVWRIEEFQAQSRRVFCPLLALEPITNVQLNFLHFTGIYKRFITYFKYI